MFDIIPNWHPMLVHFSISLFTVSAVFFLLSKFAVNWRLEDQWLAVGYWSLWSGSCITLVTMLSGWLAFATVARDASSYEAMLIHRNLSMLTLGIFVFLAVWAAHGFRAKKEPSFTFVLIIGLSCGLLFATAWHGEQLVYRHGVGVMSLPTTDIYIRQGRAAQPKIEQTTTPAVVLSRPSKKKKSE